MFAEKSAFLERLIERLHARLGNFDHFLVLVVIQFQEKVVNRVYAHAVMAYFVMEVGGQREPRVARLSDDVASTYVLTFTDIDFAQMTVSGGISVAMVDDDGVTRGGSTRDHIRNPTVGRRKDPRAFSNGEIDSLMGGQTFIKRVDAFCI